MSKELKVLFVEDSQVDMELSVRELRKAGIALTERRCETRECLLKELDVFDPDLVFSDYNMPGFETQEEAVIQTPFGDPSDNFVLGKLGGRQVAFLPAETLLCLAASFLVNHPHFGGSTAHQAI